MMIWNQKHCLKMTKRALCLNRNKSQLTLALESQAISKTHVDIKDVKSTLNARSKIIGQDVFVYHNTLETHTKDADPTKTYVEMRNAESMLNARSKIIRQHVFVYLNTLDTHTEDAYAMKMWLRVSML